MNNNKIKLIRIRDNTVTVSTFEDITDSEYVSIIMDNIRCNGFCDITYDGSYTTIIVRRYSR